MADPVVMLPEPSSEDAEDVVWGVSTAKTLWTRGERKEAIVWIRRAAEAAMAASQSFRATELLMYASELEDVLDSLPAAKPQGEASSPASGAPVAAAPGADGSPERTSPTPAAAPPPARSAPAAAPASGTVPRPATGAPPPPPASRPPVVIPPAPPAPNIRSAPAAAAVSAAAAATVTSKETPSSRPPAETPSSRPPAVAMPSPASTSKPASVPPPSRTPSSSKLAAATSSPPASSGEPASRKEPGSARSNELDPWAEETTSPGTMSPDAAGARREGNVQRQSDGNVLVIEMRARQAPPREEQEDDDVITSAAPLEEVLKRKGPSRAAPPPLPSPTSRPPTQLANVGPASTGTPSAAADRPQAPAADAQAARAPAAPQVLKPLSPGMLPTPPAAPAGAPAPRKITPAPDNEPMGRASFADIKLADISAFGDLPTDVHDLLTEVARVEELAKDEEVSGFGATLVVQGDAVVSANIVDTPAHRATRGTLVPARGTLGESVALRVIAGPEGARVAVWNQAVLDMALKSCPWVLDELRPLADRLQALAGATMGPLGELEEGARAKVIDRMTIRVVQPHEIIAEQGQKLPWLAVVGAGAVELLKGEPARVTGEVGAGDFVFPGVVVRDLPAPTTIRAGAAGAILLTGDQALARDILTGSPPLIGILGE